MNRCPKVTVQRTRSQNKKSNLDNFSSFLPGTTNRGPVLLYANFRGIKNVPGIPGTISGLKTRV